MTRAAGAASAPAASAPHLRARPWLAKPSAQRLSLWQDSAHLPVTHAATDHMGLHRFQKKGVCGSCSMTPRLQESRTPKHTSIHTSAHEDSASQPGARNTRPPRHHQHHASSIKLQEARQTQPQAQPFKAGVLALAWLSQRCRRSWHSAKHNRSSQNGSSGQASRKPVLQEPKGTSQPQKMD